MNRFPLNAAVIALFGAAFGHRLWGWMPLEVHSIVVSFLGGIAALSTTLAFQAIRKSDDLAKISGLDNERKATFQRTARTRRLIIRNRGLTSFFAGISAVAAAAALKAPMAAPYVMYLIWIAYGAVAIAVVCNVAQFIEHEKLSRLIIDTEYRLQKDAEDAEFYRGVTT